MRQAQPIRRTSDPTTAPTMIAHTGGCLGPDEDSGGAVCEAVGEAELSFLTCVGSLADVIEIKKAWKTVVVALAPLMVEELAVDGGGVVALALHAPEPGMVNAS